MRWFTIRFERLRDGSWVWHDRAGWGPGVSKNFFYILFKALKGE